MLYNISLIVSLCSALIQVMHSLFTVPSEKCYWVPAFKMSFSFSVGPYSEDDFNMNFEMCSEERELSDCWSYCIGFSQIGQQISIVISCVTSPCPQLKQSILSWLHKWALLHIYMLHFHALPLLFVKEWLMKLIVAVKISSHLMYKQRRCLLNNSHAMISY